MKRISKQKPFDELAFYDGALLGLSLIEALVTCGRGAALNTKENAIADLLYVVEGKLDEVTETFREWFDASAQPRMNEAKEAASRRREAEADEPLDDETIVRLERMLAHEKAKRAG